MGRLATCSGYPDQDSVIRRAALGLGLSLTSLGEGGFHALLLVCSFVASRSSRRFILRLCLCVLGPTVGARTTVMRLLTCLDSPGWSPRHTPGAAPRPRLPSAKCVTPLAPLPPLCTARFGSVLVPRFAISSRRLPLLHTLLRPSFIGLSCFVVCRPRHLLGLFAGNRCPWFTKEGQALPLWGIAQLGSP